MDKGIRKKKNDVLITNVKLSVEIKANGSRIYTDADRETYCLILFLAGRYKFVTSAGETVYAKAGNLLYIKKGESYSLQYNYPNQQEEYHFIVISFDIIDPSNLWFIPRMLTPADLQSLHTLFAEQLEYSQNPQLRNPLMARSNLYHILSVLYIESISMSKLTDTEISLEASKHFIEIHFNQKISIEEIAQLSGYSISHFKKLFKEYYGIAPYDYVIVLRIEKAKQLLTTNLFTISEISNLCGFANENYFSRAFKKYVGCSPSKF